MSRIRPELLLAFLWLATLSRVGEALAATPPGGEALSSDESRVVSPATSTGALQVSGYVQADWFVTRESSQNEVTSTGAPLNQDRFAISRGRLRLDTDQGELVGALEFDANTLNGPHFGLVDAEVSYRLQGPKPGWPPLLLVSAGLLKVPFGFEVPELDPRRHFLERSTVARALFPGTHDLGVRLLGGYRWLRYAIAFTNGEPMGESSFPGVDPNGSKDLVGRFGVDVPVEDWLRIRAGVSGLSGTGFHKGTPETKDTLIWRDDNQDGFVQSTEVQAIKGVPATPSADFPRFAVGGDLGVAIRIPILGDLRVFGEIVRSMNLDRGVRPVDPIGAGRDYRELGYYVAVTQELTQYGMVGVRYDEYKPDSDASEQRGVSVVPRNDVYSDLALAGSLRYGMGRLIGQYDHRGNSLARSASGAPMTLADDSFTLRAELKF